VAQDVVGGHVAGVGCAHCGAILGQDAIAIDQPLKDLADGQRAIGKLARGRIPTGQDQARLASQQWIRSHPVCIVADLDDRFGGGGKGHARVPEQVVVKRPAN